MFIDIGILAHKSVEPATFSGTLGVCGISLTDHSDTLSSLSRQWHPLDIKHHHPEGNRGKTWKTCVSDFFADRPVGTILPIALTVPFENYRVKPFHELV